MLAFELRRPSLEVVMKNILLVSLAGFAGIGTMALGQTPARSFHRKGIQPVQPRERPRCEPEFHARR